jgi:hypothetical protein
MQITKEIISNMAYLLLCPEKHRLSIYHGEMIDAGACHSHGTGSKETRSICGSLLRHF